VLQQTPEITTTGRNYDTYYFDQSPFDRRIRELAALTRLTLRPGQVQALQSLAEGKDVVLVAKTGYGKTLIFTGYNLLTPPTIRPITLFISSLVAIEQDQAEELKNRFGARAVPTVLDGKNNTAELRGETARGSYTHVWASAEVVLVDLVWCTIVEGCLKMQITKSPNQPHPLHSEFYPPSRQFTTQLQVEIGIKTLIFLCNNRVIQWLSAIATRLGQIKMRHNQWHDSWATGFY
jgi:DEAD/DEAH box helicase